VTQRISGILGTLPQMEKRKTSMMIRNVCPAILSLVLLGSAAHSQQEIYVDTPTSFEMLKTPIVRASRASGTLALTSTGGVVKIVDLSSMKERVSLKGTLTSVSFISLTASGHSLVTASIEGQLALWNTTTGMLTKEFARLSAIPAALAVQGESYVYAAGEDKKLVLFDALTGTQFQELPASADEIVGIGLHPNGKDLALGTSSGQVRVYSLPQLTLVKQFVSNTEKVSVISFNPSGTLLVAGTAEGSIFVWETQTWTLKKKISQHTRGVTSLSFDPLVKWMVSTSADSTLKVLDLVSFAGVKSLRETDGYYTFTSFVSNDTLLAATSKGFLKKWRILATPPDTANPSVIVLQPTARGEQGAVKTVSTEYEILGIAYDDSEVNAVVVNGKSARLTPLSSFDDSKVPTGMKGKRFSALMKLDSVGLNTAEIKAFDKVGHSAKQSITVNRLSMDQSVEILAPAANDIVTGVSTQIQFKPWFEVEQYSIAVNLVEMVSNAVPTGKSVGNIIQEEISLLVGDNQIQLTVVGKQGEKFTRSLSVTRKVTGAVASGAPSGAQKKPRGSGPQAWAVVVGLSEYGSSGIPSLKYADRDAEAFADFLRRPEGGGYDTDHLHVLLNKDATLSNIKDALVNFLGQAIDIDLVIIYFAGHGAPEPARPQNLYLLTYDTDPNVLGTTAFPMWQIQDVIGRYINAKRIVVFSDACHSGGISVNFATRGLGVTENNLINQYLADLSKSKEGTVVFTASAAGEVSQEFPELAHGVFTYYLLEGLEGKADFNNDYVITINEAMQYVEEQVKRKTKGAQNPTRSQTSYDKELTVATIPH
jgi:WD40 repeat protein